MKIRVHKDGILASLPEELEDVGSVVIYDDFEQPILVVQKIADGTIYSSKASDPEFPGALRALGIGLNNPVRVVPR